MESYIATIRLFAGNFAPRGWFFCHGQVLQIAQYSALFSLLGTTYGGDGMTTFALPDLRGRVPVGAGMGPGLTARTPGQAFGAETVTLLSSQLPAHAHGIPVQLPPEGTTAAPPPDTIVGYAGVPGATMGVVQSTPVGSGQPVPITPPSLGLNYIICVDGIFPSRP